MADIWDVWKEPEEPKKESSKKGFGLVSTLSSDSDDVWSAWQGEPAEGQPETRLRPMTVGEGFKKGLENIFLSTPGAAVMGMAKGVTTELPKLAGEAAQFVGEKTGFEAVEKAGKSVADWAKETGKKLYGKEPKYTGLAKAAYEGTKMLGPSIIPGGVATASARTLLGVGKLVKAAKAAGETAEAAKLFARANRLASTAIKAGSGAAAGLFGLAQAQQTTETGERRAAELETAGNYSEADKVRKSLKYAPYINGLIEGFGEYFGTKYLGKALGLSEVNAAKRGAWNVAKDFLKTLGVEVGTEVAQSGGEAGIEKITGIRPEADPLKEAFDVVGPTVFMTLLTGGLGAGARRLKRGKAETVLEEDPTEAFLKNVENRLNNPEDTIVVPTLIEGMMGDPRFEGMKSRLQDILDRHLEGEDQTVKALETEPVEPVDRRQDRELRKKVADMTPEEREQALLTDPLTGQRNQRAYNEAEARQPFQASIDVDGLKYVNDTFGHEAGNELLRKVGEVFNRVTPEGMGSYHFHGDEFAMEGQTPEQIEETVAAAKQLLAEEPLTFTDETGKEVRYVADFSHGTAETMTEADKAMQVNKTERRVQRGAAPINLVLKALETDTHGQKIDELIDSPELAEEKVALEPGAPVQQAPIQEGVTPEPLPFSEIKPDITFEAQPQDYTRRAEELGLKFNGMQERVDLPDVPMFTDSEQGGTFVKRDTETLEEAVQRHRDKFKRKEVTTNAEEIKSREAETKGQTKEGEVTTQEAPLPLKAEAETPQLLTPVLNERGRIDVKATEKTLPSIEEGKIRLYRVEKKAGVKGVPEALTKEKNVAGDYYTSDLEYAGFYKEAYGKEAPIRYVDVSKEYAEQNKIPGKKTGAEYLIRTGQPAERPAPATAPKKVKKVSKKIPKTVVTPTPEKETGKLEPLNLTKEITKAITDKPSGLLSEHEERLAKNNGVPVIVPKSKRLALENALFNDIIAKTGELGGVVTQEGEDRIGKAVFKVNRPYGNLVYDEATGQLSFERYKLTADMAVKEAKFGVDKTLLLQTISKDIVNNDLSGTIANETIQNALDSYPKGQKIKKLSVDIDAVRTEDGIAAVKVTVEDNGMGMTENEVTKNLLRLGAKGKAGTNTRGGYGLAKAAFLLTPIRSKITTVKNGIETTLEGTREQFFGIKAAGNPTIATDKTDQPNGTKFELVFFENADEAKEQNAFSLSMWGAESAFLEYINNGILVEGVYLTYGTFGREQIKKTLTSVKSIPKIFPTKKLTINENTVTINFVEDEDPPHRNWSGSFSPRIETFNKGLALLSIKPSTYAVTNLTEQPQWKVVIDFEKTVDVRNINYPFIRNRTELNREVQERITDIINEQITALNEATFTGKKADFDRMVNSSPVINGVKVLIPFKDKSEFEKAEKVLRDNKQVVGDLADVFTSFQRVIDKIGGKQLNLVMTIDPSVHGYRSNPEVTGHEFYAINPFAITDSLLHHALLAEVTNKEFDDLTAMASNLVHTLVHEYTHNTVGGHNEAFTWALAQNYMKISHALLARLEFQTRRFYENHKDALAGLQTDFASMGKGGSQFSKDSLAVSAARKLVDRAAVGERNERPGVRREEIGPIAPPQPTNIQAAISSLYEDAFGGGGIENPPSGGARDIIGKKIESFMYWLVDKNRPIELIQKKLASISEDIDLFLRETQRPKVAAARIKDAWATDIVPFLKEIAKSEISLPELEEYAHAVHAPEANGALRFANAKRFLDNIIAVLPEEEETRKEFQAMLRADKVETPQDYFDWLHAAFNLFGDIEKVAEIERKWNAFKEKPSGMTDREAAEIINAYAGDEKIEELRLMLLSINNRRLDILRDAGLLADAEYTAYKNKYKNYVPLYREGFEEETPGSGRGIQAAGRPVKTRMGSSRKVVNIMANSVANYEAALARSEKAASARIFLNLVKANPDPGLWSIHEVKKSPRYDDYGNLHLYPDPLNVKDHEIRIMVDGRQHLISVAKNDTDLMRMIRVLKAQDLRHGTFLNAFAKINKWLARVYTSWSPTFMFTNPVRDLQTAGINIEATGIKMNRRKMFKGAFDSAKAIYRVETNKRKGDALEAMYDRFKKAGGKISISDAHKNAEEVAKKLNRELANLSGERPVRATVSSWLTFFESMNTAIENGVRLYAFRLAIEQGKSDKKAANIASDLTVDFTKSGAAGLALNALYLFANPGIQGSYRMIRGLIKNKTTRYKIVPGIFAAGFLTGLYNSLLGGVDDDGEDHFNKIDDFIKERNAIFMIPGTGGHHAQFPLPWGYNFFWGVGTELARSFTQKNYKPIKGGVRLASTFANAFNPVAAGTLLQTIAPTVLDPIAMVGENKNWYGGELMPSQNIFAKVKTPDSQRFWKSTSSLSKWVASSINALFGGSEVRSSGLPDVSPETLDLLVDIIGGSMLKFFTDTLVTIPKKLIADEEIRLRNIPFVRSFVGQKSEWADSRLYHTNVTEVLTASAELKNAKGTDEYEKLSTQLRPFKDLIPRAHAAEYKLRQLRKSRTKAEMRKDSALVKEKDKQITETYLRFNKTFNEAMEKK